MDVVIEAIKFNHDPNSATVDALTIRKNATEDISGPEWQRQDGQQPPKTAAVAYASTQGNAVTIAVQLRRFNLNVQRVHITAESTSVLGNVIRNTIEFSGKNELSDFKALNLGGARISSAAVGKSNVVLLWRLEVDSGQPPNRVFEQQTEHTVYTLLESPKEPWGPGYEPPWTEALDLACDWAAGATDRTQAAAMITRRLHGLGLLGLLRFAQKVSFSRLSYNGTHEVKLTRFLKHLEGSAGPLTVSCTDCAVLVSTFANILGCDLYQSEMGLRFGTNRIRVIGFQNEGSTIFEFHEVAWEFPCDSQARLFDCCLQVDGGSDPSDESFDPLLPINIPLGDANGTDYHFRLARKGTGAHMHAFPDSRERRHIAHDTFSVRQINPDLEEILKEQFQFSSWTELPAPDRLLHGPVESITKAFTPDNWKLDVTTVLQAEDGRMSLSETIWHSYPGDAEVLRLLVYKCASVIAAREFLLNLLGGFQTPVIERRVEFPDVPIGDLAFADPEDLTFLFARSNLVVFVQNADDSLNSVLSFAQNVDLRILKVLRDEPGDKASRNPTDLRLSKEEKFMSLHLEGTRWTSTMPLGEPAGTPNNADPDGIFQFERYDPITGTVEGTFYDLATGERPPFSGSVTFNGGTSYIFVLHHVIPGFPGLTRLYEGELLVTVPERIALIAGSFRVPGTERLTGSDKAALATQDEGVWIATKP